MQTGGQRCRKRQQGQTDSWHLTYIRWKQQTVVDFCHCSLSIVTKTSMQTATASPCPGARIYGAIAPGPPLEVKSFVLIFNVKNCAKLWTHLKIYTWNIPPASPIFTFLNTQLMMWFLSRNWSRVGVMETVAGAEHIRCKRKTITLYHPGVDTEWPSLII